MQEIIQKLIFPDDEILRDNYALYYRGLKGCVTSVNGHPVFHLPQFITAEFNTYFNGLSLEKWKRFTSLQSAKLQLTLSGTCTVRLFGCHLQYHEIVKTVYEERHYNFASPTQVQIPVPDVTETMIAFEIAAEGPVTLTDGAFLGEFGTAREIDIAIATTTCRKEVFIKSNIRILKEQILDSSRDLSRHLYIHIVDNGRTLKRSDFPEDDRIELHPNKNTGGSGGYARGMIESLHQKKPVTHVLLMDDDVRVQPESFFKTYELLRHLKPAYQDYFINGTMLYLNQPSIQHEDVGIFREGLYFGGLHRGLNQADLYCCLINEKPFQQDRHYYGAWWYCVIPRDVIKKNGLPLPLFIRCDDMEYGIRCHTGYLTMNGICVWHMGFAGKYNALMDDYMAYRNMLISQAAGGQLDDVSVFHIIHLNIRKHLLRMDYKAAELSLRAVEDFYRGPGFIAQDRGEEILKENGKLVEKMVPLSELGITQQIITGDLMFNPPMRRLEKLLFRITYNGQLIPVPFRRASGMIPCYNDCYTPGRYVFRKTVYAINPENETGYLLHYDRKQFLKLYKRYLRVLLIHKYFGKRIQAHYRRAQKYLVSERFWRKYLEI